MLKISNVYAGFRRLAIGLKIRWPQGRVGSIPSTSTTRIAPSSSDPPQETMTEGNAIQSPVQQITQAYRTLPVNERDSSNVELSDQDASSASQASSVLNWSAGGSMKATPIPMPSWA